MDPEVVTWTQREGILIFMYILPEPPVFYNIYTVIALLHSSLVLAFDFAEFKVVQRKSETIRNFSSICVVLFSLPQNTLFDIRRG